MTLDISFAYNGNQTFCFMNYRPYLLLLTISVMFFSAGCGETGTESAQITTSGDQAGEQAVTKEDAPGSHQRTRGLGQATDGPAQEVAFDQDFPTLARVLGAEQALLADLSAYANTARNAEMIQSEADLTDLLERRDSSMIPRLEAVLMTLDQNQELYEDYDNLQTELQQLGMQMTFAEGMFTSVGPFRFLEEEIEQYASPGFRLFLQFREAQTASFNGEYPYLNMGPYIEMVEIGEEMKSLSDHSYYSKIEDDFQQAVIAVSDIHLVSDPVAREEASWFVSDINTEFYPFATEADTRQAYVQQTEGSPFQKAMEKIIANPSSMTKKPTHLYLIVVEWVEDEEIAVSRVASHLTSGEDIPHHLEVNLADGTRKYAIVYRFFEEVEEAEEALETVQADFPEADLMMVSVNKGSLYQLGG